MKAKWTCNNKTVTYYGKNNHKTVAKARFDHRISRLGTGWPILRLCNLQPAWTSCERVHFQYWHFLLRIFTCYWMCTSCSHIKDFFKINIDDFDIQLAAASRCLSSRPSDFPRDESTKVFEEGEGCVGCTGQQVSCCCCRGQRYGLHAYWRRSRNCPR